jgi:hypothetical protein
VPWGTDSEAGQAGHLPLHGLNPAALQPPFAWSIGISSRWRALDTGPSSRPGGHDAFLQGLLPGVHLLDEQRDALCSFLDALVEECRQAGQLLTLVRLARLSDGALGSAALQFRWLDSAPDPAYRIREVLSATVNLEDVRTNGLPALLARTEQRLARLGDRRRVWSVTWELFVPVESTTWTAVLVAASPHAELESSLRALVLSVADTLTIRPDGGSPGPVRSDGRA